MDERHHNVHIGLFGPPDFDIVHGGHASGASPTGPAGVGRIVRRVVLGNPCAMRRIVEIAALAVLVGSGLPVVASAAPGMAWGACPAVPGAVLDARQECTTLRVPLDYGDPGGARISLA